MSRQSSKVIQGIQMHTPTNPNDEGIYVWLDEEEKFGLIWLGKEWLLVSALATYQAGELGEAGEAMKAMGVARGQTTA